MTKEQIYFEQRKLLAAFLTALGVALMAASLFKPASDFLSGAGASGIGVDRLVLSFTLALAGVALHLAGQWILLGGSKPLWPQSPQGDSPAPPGDAIL